MLSILGDVYLDKEYSVDVNLDQFILNLEYPLSRRGRPALNKVNLGQGESYLIETMGKPPVAVCLANNHILDFGDEGYIDTIEFLKKAGIKFFGAGDESDNFNNPCYVSCDGNKFALMGYCCSSTSPSSGERYSVPGIDIDRIKNDIEVAKSNSDFVIVVLHWGEEEIKYPKPKDVFIAKEIIDSGADLVVGHHAHVVQSAIQYNGKKIFFGVGNFIFPNIDVDSKFDGEKYLDRFKKVQRKENKRSLLVDIDNTFFVSTRGAKFEKGRVEVCQLKVSEKILNESQFFKHYKKYIRFKKISNFIRYPRLLSFDQIRRFIKG